MTLPFVSRRRYDTDLAAARAEAGRLREQRDTAVRDEETARFNRERILRQYTALDEKHTAVCLVNVRLTEDLTKERQVSGSLARQIHEMAQPVEPDPDAVDWAAKYEAETERADRLQAELDDARLLASRLTAVVETRQNLDDAERPVDAAPASRREGPSARLRRERDRVRRLEQRLSDMQVSHVADTRELHDLRQGVQK
ncbi:hypothetical protein QA942_19615 [Streptomyces sp. B21-106]|uniref:hypothetical protein n=1 Tax=Streptomyces sp. B21-106 TaxID=3039418 RepID=UPI002FEFB7BE